MYKFKRKNKAEPVLEQGEIGESRLDVVEPPRHEVRDDGKSVADVINARVQNVSASAIQDIDRLTNELRMSREHIRLEGERVHRAMIQYATLSQSVLQSTKIISEKLVNWKTVPEVPASDEEALTA